MPRRGRAGHARGRGPAAASAGRGWRRSGDRVAPACLELGHRGGQDPGLDECRLPGEWREDRGRVRTELAERGQQPVARLAVGPGQPVEPRAGVHPVVALLAQELADELGQRSPRPACQRLEPDGVGAVVQAAPGDRHRPVTAAVVEQPAVAVVGGLAIVGKRVGIAAGQLGQQPVQRGRVAQLVLGERAHRDVLFEQRRDPGPLRVGEADHELVVGHRAAAAPASAVASRGGGRDGRSRIVPSASPGRPALVRRPACRA